MATSPDTPRRTRLEHDERREQILTCARRLFSDRSYSAVSTTEIAREAGVARGLLHHYFGTKRDLYVEVVRTLVRLPPPIPKGDLSARGLDDILDETIDGWLEMVSRNRGTWFAALGVDGLGHDGEVEAILEEARIGTVDRFIDIVRVDAGLGEGDVHPRDAELRAAVRSVIGLAETATREWLVRDRLTRDQTHVLITRTMSSVVRDVVPLLADVPVRPRRARPRAPRD